MAMNKQTLHTLVGAATLLVAAFVVFISHQGGPRETASGYPIVGRFASIDGIGVGTKVLLTGIEIGKVAGYTYDLEGQRAIVTFTIRDDIKIPLDSVALIVSDGLLGAKYIKIQPGGEIDMMQSGDEFEYVQDAIAFEEILEKVILNAEQQRSRDKEKDDAKPEPNQASIESPEPASTERTTLTEAVKIR